MRTVLLVFWLATVGFTTLGQEPIRQNSDEKFAGWMPSRSKLPKAYQQEAIRLILREATQVATALKLSEPLPISETNLTEYFLSPLRFAQETGAIGNITAQNYRFSVPRSNKLCYIMGLRQEENLLKWEKDYSWPLSRMDTNAAYQLATQWLYEISIDVEKLNSIYRVVIEAEDSYGQTNRFVPAYWVYWALGPKGSGSAASVRLFLPTKTLMQLRVENVGCILRPPITFTNIDALLSGP
jgi:hypothetical protein